MNKLIELSVKGSLYFYLCPISENQLLKLKQFATEFYISNVPHQPQSDDEIAKKFVSSANQILDIELEKVHIDSVIVIK